MVSDPMHEVQHGFRAPLSVKRVMYHTLLLRVWLAGIDPKRVREEIRPEILRYQREVVDVLYTTGRSLPKR